MDYREGYERGRRYRDEGDVWDRRDYDRRHDRRHDDDRGLLERLADELRSWFGDEEPRRGPRADRESQGRWGGGGQGWGSRAGDEEVDRDWARQWGYVDRSESGQRHNRWREPQRYTGSSWTRERGYGGEGYRGEREGGERYDEPRPGWGDPSAWGVEPGWPERDPSRWSGVGGGPHAGQGPRGYQRSDERIREDVCDVLCEHGYIDASEIEVTVLHGEVTLGGAVSERSQKRMAEDAVERVSGVRDVHNQLRVTPGGSGQERPERPSDPRFRAA